MDSNGEKSRLGLGHGDGVCLTPCFFTMVPPPKKNILTLSKCLCVERILTPNINSNFVLGRESSWCPPTHQASKKTIKVKLPV